MTKRNGAAVWQPRHVRSVLPMDAMTPDAALLFAAGGAERNRGLALAVCIAQLPRLSILPKRPARRKATAT
jgi:hypothetical protein